MSVLVNNPSVVFLRKRHLPLHRGGLRDAYDAPPYDNTKLLKPKSTKVFEGVQNPFFKKCTCGAAILGFYLIKPRVN